MSTKPDRFSASQRGWREKLYIIIFEADTRPGKIFDLALLVAILASVFAVMLESVDTIHAEHGDWLHVAEWAFTILFTFEYLLRIFVSHKPRAYIFSFFGVIDLLACLPTYVELFLAGAGYLLVIRILRMLRIFRILKMARHLKESTAILNALKSARPKITVFLFAIVALTLIMGTLMYIIEGGQEGGDFTSIPTSIYWSIVTITTVGYGDITPHTVLGQFVSAIMMIMGYAIIAIPTGVITVELIREVQADKHVSTRTCPDCHAEGHQMGANYCFNCARKFVRRENEL